MLSFRKKKVPKTNETVEADVVRLWIVKWQSGNSEYSTNTSGELCAFTSEDEAIKFKESLIDAFKLIRHTHGNSVSIAKQ